VIPDEPPARKRYGQHFLHDPGVLERMVASLDPGIEDGILEIGPGTGALTEAILERVPHLHAVEIDGRLVAHLRLRFPPHRVTVLEDDALRIDFTSLARTLGRPVRVVGNLPYNVSSPLLFHCLRHTAAIQDMHVLLQREVALRMVARANTPDYGRLTVALAARASVESLFEVGPGAFRPPPRVRSRWVRLVPYSAEPFPGAWEPAFTEIVAQAFQKRRKTLANALRGLLSERVLHDLELDPRRRPETLEPEEFGRLACSVSRTRGRSET
jgi:16S rRNA (adenine1518-N6/adenine1519-N6)-dimethyltransferase